MRPLLDELPPLGEPARLQVYARHRRHTRLPWLVRSSRPPASASSRAASRKPVRRALERGVEAHARFYALLHAPEPGDPFPLAHRVNGSPGPAVSALVFFSGLAS